MGRVSKLWQKRNETEPRKLSSLQQQQTDVNLASFIFVIASTLFVNETTINGFVAVEEMQDGSPGASIMACVRTII